MTVDLSLLERPTRERPPLPSDDDVIEGGSPLAGKMGRVRRERREG